MKEVAVIGAGGAAGLASCKEAISQGMKVMGFESSQRIGGKIFNSNVVSLKFLTKVINGMSHGKNRMFNIQNFLMR